MIGAALKTESPRLTLDARLYHDPAAWAREQEGIFFSEWMIFCHEALVREPGQYVAYTVAGRPVMVIRGNDGALKAFHNVCRHRAGMVLQEGCGKTAALRCMYHGWVYDTDGRLRKAPGFGGDEQALCDRTQLFPVHAESRHGLVFICLAQDPPPFSQSLGGLPAALEGTDLSGFSFFGMATHTLRCNWKNYIENYMEGYHIPVLHPALNREIDFPTYRVVPGDRVARHETGLRDPGALSGGLWLWLWPNAALNIYKDGMNLELVVPTGPETTELRYCYLFRDVSPEKEEENRRAISLSRTVTQEDIDICEIVQRNLRAGVYVRGELSPRHEGGLGYFQDLVRKIHGPAA